MVNNLFHNNVAYDNLTFTYAAYYGNLEIMKVLYKNSCPWNGYTFIAAIKNGNFENIKWLEALHCPYNTRELSDKVK